MVYPEPQILFEPLVGPFRLSVGSGVICRGDVSFNSKLLAQFVHELRCKPGVSVRDDLRWYAKPGENVVEI